MKTILRSARPLIYVVFIHVILGLSAITIICLEMHYRVKRMIVIHLLLVLGLSVVAILAAGLPLTSVHLRKTSWGRLLVCAILTVALIAHLLFYTLNFVTNKEMGANLSWDFVAFYSLHLKELLMSLPFSPLLIAAPLTVITIITLAAYMRSYPAIRESFRTLSTVRNTTTGPRSILFVTVAIFAVYVCCLTGSIWEGTTRKAGMVLQYEPILSFFAPVGWQEKWVDLEKEKAIRHNYSSPKTFDKRNVIIITVDSVRADHLQIYGYERPTSPFLVSEEKEGRLKKVAFAASICSHSECGIAATLTSKEYKAQSPGNFGITEMLRDQGYKVYYLLSGFHRAARGIPSKRLYGENVDFLYDCFNLDKFPVNDDRVLLDGLEQVPESSGAPTLFYFHLMSPHVIGIRLKEFERYRPFTQQLSWELILKGQADILAMKNEYDNKITQADWLLGEIFSALGRKGYLRNSIAFVLADHGEGLGEHHHNAHSIYLYQEDIHIPLLIFDDPSVSYPNLGFATQLDVAPTIADRLGLPIPPSWQGVSLLQPASDRYTYYQAVGKRPNRAVIYKTDKALYEFIKSPDGDEQLFELQTDPSEKHNRISDVDPSLVESLRNSLKAHFGV